MKKDKIKLAVCGGLGLDSPFYLPDEELCREYRSESREAFSNMIDIILSRGVDVAIFCGPLFDVARIGERNAKMLCDAFSAVRSCRFVLFRSAPDGLKIRNLYDTNRFSENVYVAGRDGVDYFDFDDIGVGVRCSIGSPAASTVRLDHEKLNILALSSPISRADASCGVYDLIAMADSADGGEGKLGSIDCVRAGSALAWDPARPIARRGGIYYIEAEKRGTFVQTSCERIELGRTVYTTLELSLDRCPDENAARSVIRNAVIRSELPRDVILRLVLTGETYSAIELGGGLELPGVRRVFVDNRTLPTADAKYLARDMTARGQLYRSFLPMIQGDRGSEVVSDAYRAGDAALCADPGRNK